MNENTNDKMYTILKRIQYDYNIIKEITEPMDYQFIHIPISNYIDSINEALKEFEAKNKNNKGEF